MLRKKGLETGEIIGITLITIIVLLLVFKKARPAPYDGYYEETQAERYESIGRP